MFRKFKNMENGYNFEGFGNSVMHLKHHYFDNDFIDRALQTTWVDYYDNNLYYVYRYVTNYKLFKFKIINKFGNINVIEFIDNKLITCIKDDNMLDASVPYQCLITLPDELFTM